MSKGLGGRLAALRDTLTHSDATSDTGRPEDIDGSDVAASAPVAETAPAPVINVTNGTNGTTGPADDVATVSSAATSRTRRRYGSTRVVAVSAPAPVSTQFDDAAPAADLNGSNESAVEAPELPVHRDEPGPLTASEGEPESVTATASATEPELGQDAVDEQDAVDDPAGSAAAPQPDRPVAAETSADLTPHGSETAPDQLGTLAATEPAVVEAEDRPPARDVNHHDNVEAVGSVPPATGDVDADYRGEVEPASTVDAEHEPAGTVAPASVVDDVPMAPVDATVESDPEPAGLLAPAPEGLASATDIDPEPVSSSDAEADPESAPVDAVEPVGVVRHEPEPDFVDDADVAAVPEPAGLTEHVPADVAASHEPEFADDSDREEPAVTDTAAGPATAEPTAAELVSSQRDSSEPVIPPSSDAEAEPAAATTAIDSTDAPDLADAEPGEAESTDLAEPVPATVAIDAADEPAAAAEPVDAAEPVVAAETGAATAATDAPHHPSAAIVEPVDAAEPGAATTATDAPDHPAAAIVEPVGAAEPGAATTATDAADEPAAAIAEPVDAAEPVAAAGPAAVAEPDAAERTVATGASVRPPSKPSKAVGSGSTPSSDDGPPRRTTTAVAGIAAVAAVIAIVVGLAMYFNRSSGHKTANAASTTATATSVQTSGPSAPQTSIGPSPTSGASASPTTDPTLPAQTQLARWAKANLSPASVIVADSSAAKTLRADGFGDVVSDVSTKTDWRTVAYLIRDRNGAKPSAFRAKLAAASAPLALFGKGASEVTVSEVHPELGSNLAARIKSDQAIRRQAGSELVKNPMLSFNPSVQSAVKAGRLDIRAASFLVQLARTTRVAVIDIVCDAGETRAGRPCRTIVVSTGDMNMLQQTLSASALSYKPINVTVIDHDSVRLQWIPAIISIAGG